MPELPTCACIGGYPPFDRLTLIYQAARELSGDTTLPSADCVAGVPPFARFAYIYAAFRALAGDDSLPSMECVEGEPFQDQITRIYQAAFAYAADSGLPAVACVRGTPIWQQWVNIYAAVYSAQGEPEELPLPGCVNATFDVLSNVYCALIAGCVTPTLLSASINDSTVTLVFSHSVTGTGALDFTVTIDGDTFTLVYVSGEGTNTYIFASPESAVQGAVVTLDYTPGDITNGDCPLAVISNFPVDNELDQFTYLRPGGAFTYFRPDGTSQYIRP